MKPESVNQFQSIDDSCSKSMFSLRDVDIYKINYFLGKINAVFALFRNLLPVAKYDFQVLVRGGGSMSQIDAIIYNVMSLLLKVMKQLKIQESDILKIKNSARKIGFYTVDDRRKNRKLAGRKKFRKKEQFSKR